MCNSCYVAIINKIKQVQDDMSKTLSVDEDWEFVSKGTEISLGIFVSTLYTTHV